MEGPAPPDEPAPFTLGQEVNVELSRPVGQAGTELGPEGQPDRGVGHGRDDASVHDPLRVEVVRAEVHGELRPAIPHGDQFEAGPAVKGRIADPRPQGLEVPLIQSGPLEVFVHPAFLRFPLDSSHLGAYLPTP
jgi:hypothetical protein